MAGETLNNYAMSVKSDGMQLENELVARNVRRFRRERVMSLGELARRSGLSKQTLSKIEQGCGNPTVDTLAQLGAALDLPARRLFTERGTPVYVKRHYEGSWVDGAERSERILDETYGSGYVRTLTLKLERVVENLASSVRILLAHCTTCMSSPDEYGRPGHRAGGPVSR